MKEEIYAYDFETFPNLTLVTFEQIYGTNKYHWWIYLNPGTKKVSTGTNLPGTTLSSFNPYKLVGFNNVRFDQLIYQRLIELLTKGAARNTIPMSIFNAAQDIIKNEKARINYKPFHVDQLDAFLILHFNNPARATSLKWIQCHLGAPIVQDLPFEFDDIIASDEIQKVLDYCYNDTSTTKTLYLHKQVQERLKVRAEIRKVYPTVQMNHPDSTMGERIFIEELEKKVFPLPKPQPFKDIPVADIILPYVVFTTSTFYNVLEYYKSKTITDPDDPKLGRSVIYDGMQYVFGSGGLHAAREGSFHLIDSQDVSSFYPNLAIKNDFRPQHLGGNFNRTYNGMYIRRQSYPKKTAMNESFKVALNSSFGKGNSKWSQLYDPSFLYSITINGQLLLAMLCEMLTESRAAKIIMANTDGIEFETHNPALRDEVLKKWQAMTGLTLEGNFYKKIIIRDVNNYIAADNKGDIKCKGAYEIDKDFNKDPSQRQSTLLVHNAMTGKTHPDTDKFESYFMFLRAKTGVLVARLPDGSAEIPLSGTIRYVVVKDGGFYLFRKNGKKYTAVHKGKKVAICNDLTDSDFDKNFLMKVIDKKWYSAESQELYEARKTDLELFNEAEDE